MRIHMKTTRIITAAALFIAGGLTLHAAQAQLSGIKRTDLLRHYMGIPDSEVIQVRVDFAPGVLVARHSHPGKEIAHVIEAG